jgi:GxxExxY protein
MEVHSELGMGFKEIVYKDALEYEFKARGVPYIREKQYKIKYKSIILPHAYNADFIIYDSTSVIINNFVKQTINYLKASGLQLGIIANFGERSFVSKRVVF